MFRKGFFAILLSSVFYSLSFAANLSIQERSGIERINEPVTCGIPLAQGWAVSPEELSLEKSGTGIPCEARTVSRWPDGSLRWVHLDFQANVAANGLLNLSLEKGTPAAIDTRLSVTEETGKVTVTTGRIRAEVLGPGFNIFNSLWIDLPQSEGDSLPGLYGTRIIAPHNRGLVMWGDGVEYSASNDQNAEITVESDGTMRVVLKIEGDLKSSTGETGFHYICRLYFYNDSPLVRLAYTFENRGIYREGWEDKVILEGLHLELPFENPLGACYAGMPDLNWDHSESFDNESYVAVRSTSSAEFVRDDLTVTSTNPKSLKTDRIGWIGQLLGSDAGEVAVGIGLQDFWQMHPGTLEIDRTSGTLTAGLIPYRFNQPIDIYSGVARTHYFRLVFLPQSESANLGKMLAACQKPLLAVAEPSYYCSQSMAFGKILERNSALYPPENLEEVRRIEQELDLGLEDQLQKVDSRSKNNVTWESYGFLNWGDGMHYAWESGVHEARNIAWNHHYYDLPHMCCLEFVRTMDYRWLDYFLSRAHHLMDVHMTHFATGNSLDGAGRYCPPTDHVRKDPTTESDYTTASVYISPYTNHHKVQGLFDRWYLTGDERSLDCALKGVEFAKSFGAYTDYDQPRGAAFQVLTLLAGYQCTSEGSYLQTAKSTFDTWRSHFRSTSTKFTNGFFMVGFLLEAFIDYYEISGDQNVTDFIKQAVDWMKANRPDEKYSNMAHGIGFLAKQIDDPGYISLEKEYLSSWQGTWSNAFKDYGLHGRSLARALYYLSYEGLGYDYRIRGDYNKDNDLTVSDVFSLLGSAIENPSNEALDFNGDGKFTIKDAVSLLIYIRSQ